MAKWNTKSVLTLHQENERLRKLLAEALGYVRATYPAAAQKIEDEMEADK